MPHKMISYNTAVSVVPNPSEAPNYTNEYTLLKLKKCIVVKEGTTSGNPTVDLQLEDSKDRKYLIMTTGELLNMIAGLCSPEKTP